MEPLKRDFISIGSDCSGRVADPWYREGQFKVTPPSGDIVGASLWRLIGLVRRESVRLAWASVTGPIWSPLLEMGLHARIPHHPR